MSLRLTMRHLPLEGGGSENETAGLEPSGRSLNLLWGLVYYKNLDAICEERGAVAEQNSPSPLGIVPLAAFERRIGRCLACTTIYQYLRDRKTVAMSKRSLPARLRRSQQYV